MVIIFLSLIPIPRLPFPEFDLSDKFFHAFLYFVMMLIWLRVGFVSSKKMELKYIYMVITIALITEILQGFLPIGRYFEFADIVSNFVGIVLGIITYKLLLSKNTLT